MKTMHSKFFKIIYPALVMLVLGFVSCKEDDEDLAPMRMFQPGGVISSSSGESSVRLSWKTPANTVAGKVTYTVEVSKDTLFQTPVLFTATTDTTSIVITDDQITLKEIYFARVKTNATEASGGESKWLTSNRFSIRGAQLFVDNPVKVGDLTDRGVRLRFIARPEVTRIVVTPTGGVAKEIVLTNADKAAGFILVDNLGSGVNHQAEIFAGTKSRGITYFRTKEPLSGNIVDLRGILDNPEILRDTIPDIQNGSTVILKRGLTYNVSTTILIDKAITITSGSDLTEPNLATIYFTSNFNTVAGANIEYINFKDVNMYSNDATARYVFNINAASTIKTMTFDNVKASMFRGIVRLQSQPTTITDFRVNNSVIDSIGSYGILNVDVATSKVENIVISNSTIYKAEKIIVSKNSSTSVLIENVTVNESPIAGQYLVDYSTAGTNNVTDGIIVKNSILGIGKAGSQAIKGVRASASTRVEAINSFSTSDYVITPASGFPIPGLTAYNATSLELWQAPKNGNFRFRNPNGSGIFLVGDPRWR